MAKPIQILLAAALLASLSACEKKAAEPVAAPAVGPVAKASIQELMKSVVEPASAIVWKTPDYFNDPEAAKKIKPEQADADWAALRKGAVALSEASNLLAMEGRVVVHPGGKLENEGQEGNLTAAQINEKLKTDRAQFLVFAKVLQDANLQTIDAIDKKNPDALLEAGGKIDEACEACHKVFWYPGAPTIQ
jgi:cytochrome c556